MKKEDNIYYLPDFLLIIDDKKYLLDIKGFVNGEDGYKNEQLKKEAGIKYCNIKKWKYVYLEDILSDVKQIKYNILNYYGTKNKKT